MATAPRSSSSATGSRAGWFAASGHGLPRPLASLAICLVVLAYVFSGGMRATAWANALQTLVFMALGLVTFLVIARGIGGRDERAAVVLSRAFIAAVVAATWSLSMVPPTAVFPLGVWCFSGFAALGPLGWLGLLVPPLPPVVLLVGLSTLVLVAVSLVTRPPDEATLRRFFPPA